MVMPVRFCHVCHPIKYDRQPTDDSNLTGGSLAYDRRQESEADHIGLFLMTFAGYDPFEAVTFWQRMQEATARRGRPPEILSDHPSDSRRIAQLRMWAPRAQAGKKAYDGGRVAHKSDRGGSLRR